MSKAAHFDGSGGTYFRFAGALTATKTYPFWYGMWVRPYRRRTGTVFTLLSSARADQSNGTWGQLDISNGSVLRAYTANGSGNSNAVTQECPIGEPYWDHVIFEFRSSTDRRIYLNGTADLGGTNGTNRAIDLTTGTPNTSIGIDSSGANPFNGDIGQVIFGTGNLTDSDRNLLASFTGGTLPTLGSGTITNHYQLSSNGTDSIGGNDMTVTGSQVYTGDDIGPIASPTRADLIQFIHGQSTVRTETPTITTGVSGPISTSGWTNLASVEQFDMSYTNRIGQTYTSRGWHYIPTTSLNHIVFINGGHETVTDWPNQPYGMSLMFQNAIAAGYAVFGWLMPDYGQSTGPGGSHDDHWTWTTSAIGAQPTYTGEEEFLSPAEMAMNNLVNRYNKRSMAGLSGGADLSCHVFALDSRFNHACVVSRGIIASRRFTSPVSDFEENVFPCWWKVEEYYRWCASPNRRYWELHHPSDIYGSALYLDASGYQSKFFAPVMAEFPKSDVQFGLDILGDAVAAHSFYQGTWDNFIAPALSTPLTPLPGGGIRYFAMQ